MGEVVSYFSPHLVETGDLSTVTVHLRTSHKNNAERNDWASRLSVGTDDGHCSCETALSIELAMGSGC